MTAHYRCPLCGATKTIRDPHRRGNFPSELPCGWRGCPGRAEPPPDFRGLGPLLD